jgi:putative transposase
MAVCVSTGAGSGLLMPELNAAVINPFLEQFARELPAGVHAVPIWDGAGYHTSKDLVVPSNVSLIQLPPYSPELNPVENLWHYLRSHHWSNRVSDGHDELESEAIRSSDVVCQDAENLKSICNAEYVRRSA